MRGSGALGQGSMLGMGTGEVTGGCPARQKAEVAWGGGESVTCQVEGGPQVGEM